MSGSENADVLHLCDPPSISIDERCVTCPGGMTLVLGGQLAGKPIEHLCFDTTEVTLGEFLSHVQEENKWEEGARGHGLEMRSVGCVARAIEFGETGERATYPMNCVSYDQARSYCESKRKRLPAEWEWEWAAVGREQGRRFPWGAESPSCSRAVLSDSDGRFGCGKNMVWPVGAKPAGKSRDGLHDMIGNVWEMTATVDEGHPVARGGGWMSSADLPMSARTLADTRASDVGFRCVTEPSDLGDHEGVPR